MQRPSGQTVPALLTELVQRQADHEALVDGERRWSYRALREEVEIAGRALLSSGIVAGDRVGILAGNRAEWIFADLAVMSIGAVSVGLNTWSTASELAYQLEHAAVKLLFIESSFRERNFVELVSEARTLAGGLAQLEDPIVFDGALESKSSWHEFLNRAPACAPAEFFAAVERVEPEQVACLLYTSGSTALPKGVPLLHQGLIANMWGIGERQHLEADDRLWLAVSLFWSLASVNALFAVLTHGATTVLQHHFDPGEALSLIERERCTVFYGTPNMVLAIAEHPDCGSADLTSLRTGVTIGTPAQVQRVADLGVAQICNVYGLTEAYGNSTVADAALPLEQRVETVGRALEGVSVAVIDPDTLTPRPPGEAGEIVLKGQVTPGYWNDPERTAEAFTADGWFRTGDLGVLDNSGYLYYRGRLKEMVKTGGINVAPAEVEGVLSTHPAVELAFVTGIADARLDEALAAIIVLRDGFEADPQALSTHCRETLAPYKTPRHFRFLDASELPLTSTGKLQRNRLAALFEP